jgi:tetratricopeptide (TPR) repeat protein
VRLCLCILVSLAAEAAQTAGRSLAQALQSGHFSEALSVADSLLRQRPTDPVAWTARGMALDGLGRIRDSLASFEGALRHSPSFEPALKGASQAAYRLGDPRAATYLERLLRVQPRNTTAHAMLGALAFEAQDCPRAIAHFEQSGSDVENNELALSQFGACLVDSGRASDAASLFEGGIKLHPASTNLRYNLGAALLSSGQAAPAVRMLSPLLQGDRVDAGVLNLLASAQARAGDLPGAVESLKRAVALTPNDDRNYLDLTVLSLEHDNPQLAIEFADAGLHHVANSPRLYTVRGIALAQLARFIDAQADFDRASRLDPDQTYASVAMSVLYTHREELDSAAAVLREKLRQSPGDYTLNYLLADTLIRGGVEPGVKTFLEAKRHLRAALKTNPHGAKALAALGKLYLKENDTAKAVEVLREAVRQDNSDRMALNQLLLALGRSGHHEEAASVARRISVVLQQDRVRGPARDGFRMTKADR